MALGLGHQTEILSYVDRNGFDRLAFRLEDGTKNVDAQQAFRELLDKTITEKLAGCCCDDDDDRADIVMVLSAAIVGALNEAFGEK